MREYKAIITRRSEELPDLIWDKMCGTRQPFAHKRWLMLLELITGDYHPITYSFGKGINW
jgi:hypothetical protein